MVLIFGSELMCSLPIFTFDFSYRYYLRSLLQDMRYPLRKCILLGCLVSDFALGRLSYGTEERLLVQNADRSVLLAMYWSLIQSKVTLRFFA
jgi:hypothetical protein